MTFCVHLKLLQLICLNLFLLHSVFLIPIPIKNITWSDIKNKDLLPADHVPGAHVEQDGDINKDYHHEAFLGTLIKEGKLVWENLAGYKLLIGIYHKVDTNKNHRVEHKELENWIHERILEHYNNAKENSSQTFIKVDHNSDGFVTWPEYKAQLLGHDPAKTVNDNTTIQNDVNGPLSRQADHWLRADFNNDQQLDKKEFLAFQHPEHNAKTLISMADEMMPHLDGNHDGNITLEEYTALPPGVVDEEDAEMDKEYQKEKAEEFKNDMDTNGDNIVTKEEMIRYLDPRHVQHATKEAAYLIRVSDRDRDGRLSEHEMLMQYELFTGSSFSNFAHILHDEM